MRAGWTCGSASQPRGSLSRYRYEREQALLLDAHAWSNEVVIVGAASPG